jgi:hypothetical protein
MSVEVYAELAAMAAEEHALVMDGRYEDLADLATRRAPLLEQLPEEAPEEALAYLQEALRCQELVTVALVAAREETARELQLANSRKRGASAYVSSVAPGQAPAAQINQLG